MESKRAVDVPQAKAFLDELLAVCEKHQMVLCANALNLGDDYETFLSVEPFAEPWVDRHLFVAEISRALKEKLTPPREVKRYPWHKD